MYSDAFETFWKAYPRKTAKVAAWKSWQRMKPSLDVVLSTLEWQKQSRQWMKDGGQFIPLPTTYLNQGRWEDEQEINAVPQTISMGISSAKSGRPMVY
jgi:hypothetical protein